MSRQLAFDLPHRTALARDDFFLSAANRDAVAALDAWRDWPGAKTVLTGPPGSGKTHLAHVWAAQSGATILSASRLTAQDLPRLATTPLVLEDCANIAGDPDSETALFHLHNLMAAARVPLLLTAVAPPRDWGITLPDLLSRILAAPLARLDPPDDALLSAVLVKLFADRQLAVAPPVIAFLLTRMDRSFAAARALVADLDAAALRRGCAITRGLAAELLGLPPPLDKDPAA